MFPSAVAREKSPSLVVGNRSPVIVSDHSHSKRGVVPLVYPMERGVVTDWDSMEQLWYHVFHDKLRINPEENSVLLSESARLAVQKQTLIEESREKTTQIMFETFKVPSMHISAEAVLALHASGRETGLVLDAGAGGSSARVKCCACRRWTPGYRCNLYL